MHTHACPCSFALAAPRRAGGTRAEGCAVAMGQMRWASPCGPLPAETGVSKRRDFEAARFGAGRSRAGGVYARTRAGAGEGAGGWEGSRAAWASESLGTTAVGCGVKGDGGREGKRPRPPESDSVNQHHTAQRNSFIDRRLVKCDTPPRAAPARGHRRRDPSVGRDRGEERLALLATKLEAVVLADAGSSALLAS